MVHKMLKTVYEEKDKCYGCGLCAHICESKAITMKADSEGFLYPSIDSKKCVNCRQCANQCIAKMSNDQNDVEVYACSSRDNTVLEHSTSGGVAYILARKEHVNLRLQVFSMVGNYERQENQKEYNGPLFSRR